MGKDRSEVPVPRRHPADLSSVRQVAIAIGEPGAVVLCWRPGVPADDTTPADPLDVPRATAVGGYGVDGVTSRPFTLTVS